MYAIQKSDMDLRRSLWANIVLSGGSTLYKGMMSWIGGLEDLTPPRLTLPPVPQQALASACSAR